MKNESIGGFIGLEMGPEKESFHPKAIALSTGRACFNLLLTENEPSKVYVPFYTCNSLLEPLLLNNIPYEFYPINHELDPLLDKIRIGGDEYFLYINYFDIKNNTALKLEKKFGSNLIIDNTQ